jgi:acid stress-induced BolA-like protein IbaG/YrbA
MVADYNHFKSRPEVLFAVTPKQIQALIESRLPDCSATVRSDDNRHYEATVISAAFAGKRSIRRHQMIYDALGDRVGADIHAISLQAFTPEEWAERRG